MIIIRKDAVLDARQKKVIAAIEPFTVGMDLEVTRGHSSPQGQLATIAKYARQQKVSFPEFMPGDPVDIKKYVPGVGLVYHWQRTWEALLMLEIIVNPPLDTVCGVEYIRPTGENMLGKIIKASPHITGDRYKAKGGAEEIFFPIDFSQKVNGVPNLNLVADIMKRAANSAGISYIKPEPKNGCVHIGTY